MANSYVISPELDEQISDSGLITDFPDLRDYLWIDGEADNTEVNHSWESLSEEIKSQVGKDWNNAIEKDSHWLTESGLMIPRQNNDLLLATGEFLNGIGIPDEFLLKPEEYGFTSTLEMLMSLSAYRSSEEGYDGIRIVYQWVSKGVETILGYGEAGEIKLFQFNNQAQNARSPFGNQVNFIPRLISTINEIYNAEVILSLFGIILRFAYETGVLNQILHDNELPIELLIQEKIEVLRGEIGDGTSQGEIITAMSFIDTPLNSGYHGLTCMTYEDISYNFNLEGECLKVKTISAGEFDGGEFVIKTSDIKHLLHGLVLSINTSLRRPDVLLSLIRKSKTL